MPPTIRALLCLATLALGSGPATAASPTWSVEYPPDAPTRSEATATAAIVDPSDNLILAGLVTGPLSIGKECRFPEGLAKHPFMVKVAPSGHLVWCHPIGPVTALARDEKRVLAVAYRRATGSPFIARVEDDGTLRPLSELRESHEVSVIAVGAKGDLFFGGCDREWLPTEYPGVPRTMVQHDGFVGRATQDGRLLWRRSVREGRSKNSNEHADGSPFDCVTSLQRSDGDDVFVGGPFRHGLALGEWRISGGEGTFVARLAGNGDLLWARSGATRLGTASYDVRPGMVVAAGHKVLVAGIVPLRAQPAGGSGILSVRPDGATDWSLGIQSDGLCCEVNDLVVGGSLGTILVAGRTARRSVQVGPKSIDMASADAFVAEISSSGAVLAARTVPGLVSRLVAVLAGSRGEWIVGSDRPSETATGVFAHWVSRVSR